MVRTQRDAFPYADDADFGLDPTYVDEPPEGDDDDEADERADADCDRDEEFELERRHELACDGTCNDCLRTSAAYNGDCIDCDRSLFECDCDGHLERDHRAAHLAHMLDRYGLPEPVSAEIPF